MKFIDKSWLLRVCHCHLLLQLHDRQTVPSVKILAGCNCLLNILLLPQAWQIERDLCKCQTLVPHSKWQDFLFTESRYNKVVCRTLFFFHFLLSYTYVSHLCQGNESTLKRVMKSKWIRSVNLCVYHAVQSQSITWNLPSSNTRRQQMVFKHSSSGNKTTSFSHSLAPFVTVLVVSVCVCVWGGGVIDAVKFLSSTKTRPLMIQEEKATQKTLWKKGGERKKLVEERERERERDWEKERGRIPERKRSTSFFAGNDDLELTEKGFFDKSISNKTQQFLSMHDQLKPVHCRRHMALKICFFSDNCDIYLSGKQIRKKSSLSLLTKFFLRIICPLPYLAKISIMVQLQKCEQEHTRNAGFVKIWIWKKVDKDFIHAHENTQNNKHRRPPNIPKVLVQQDRSRSGAPMPPMTDVGTETAFRLDQRKHFRKSKHLLRSEVSWCDLHLRRSTWHCTSE